MKPLTVVVVFALFIIGISGYLIKVQTPPPAVDEPEILAPVSWVHLQKLVLPLFENVCEVSVNPTIRRLAQEFTLDVGDYTKPEVVTNLRNLDSKSLLSKGEIFSEYNPDHMNELKIIYEVLYNAKDFNSFYKTAAWARQNLNCGMYVSAIYLAMLNRKDTEMLTIPAPYELLPNYFVDMNVIIKASSILAGEIITPSEYIREEGHGYTLDANYTAMFYDNDDDSKLAYFREDVGLNSYYFLRKLKLAPWLNKNINSRYGENMYQMMKQFTTRYNLERYANGLPEIDSLDWDSLSDTSYKPMLVYSNGNEFAHRTSHIDLTNNEEVAFLQTIENNIVTVVGHMRQSGYNKTQILNHLMEILVTGDRSYETLARQLLGKDLSNNGHTSVLDHYMTSLRDPMFWKINKKIVDMVDSALKVLTPYSMSELFFPGVEVVNVDVKKAMTVYDYFEFDVSDALKIDDTNSTFSVKIGQPRLNIKPFTVTLNISSLVASKGLVKVYLGPKFLPGQFVERRNLFTLYDMFEINLKKGNNIISRKSDEIKYYAPDLMSLATIRKKVEYAEYGLDSLPLKTIKSQVGYPLRLTLPKGKSTGLPLQIFVFVAPFYKANIGELYSTNTKEFNDAVLSPGYPLDLAIEDKLLLRLPNAMTKYITVTQKGDSKVENYGGAGVTKKWYSVNTYEPASRPAYSGSNGNSFDYNSKKDQYGKKEDFAVENNEYIVNSQNVIPSEENQDQEYFSDAPRLLLSSQSTYSGSNGKSFDYISKKDKYVKGKDFEVGNNEYNVNSQNVISSEETQDQVPYLDAPRLLSSSPFDYAKFKKKEPFDYQAKKVQFDKKDYTTKKGDYTKYRIISTTDQTTSMKTIAPVEDENMPVNEQSLKLDNGIYDLDNIEPHYVNDYNDENDIDNEDSNLLNVTPKRIPTILDFLIHGFDFDYSDIKLYE